MTIEKDQRVRLNEHGIRFFYVCPGVSARRHPEWEKRVGRVQRFSPDRTRAYVIWDGNRWPSDAVPVTYLVDADLDQPGGPEAALTRQSGSVRHSAPGLQRPANGARSPTCRDRAD